MAGTRDLAQFLVRAAEGGMDAVGVLGVKGRVEDRGVGHGAVQATPSTIHPIRHLGNRAVHYSVLWQQVSAFLECSAPRQEAFSMAIATPETLEAVFSRLRDVATRLTEEQQQKLDDVFTQIEDLTETAKDLPRAAREALDEIADNPDWWSLLVFVMVQVGTLDTTHLEVGAMQPVGWGRMVTLTYRADGLVPTATLGLALVKDHGADGKELRRGFVLQIHSTVDYATPPSTYGVSVDADGAATWEFPFTGSVVPPGHGSRIVVSIFWDPPDPRPGPVGLTTGRALASLTLDSTAAEHYSLSIGLGDPRTAAGAGVRVRASLDEQLGVLSQVISIAGIDEQYSPVYTRSFTRAGTFDLNHRAG